MVLKLRTVDRILKYIREIGDNKTRNREVTRLVEVDETGRDIADIGAEDICHQIIWQSFPTQKQSDKQSIE